MISGRVEARMTVPVGGAAFSASNGAQSAAQSLTIPAGNYYQTAAGGVSGLLSTFQSYLNDNVQGYPTTAAAMQAAVGWGKWSAGWLLNETSGSPIAAFGSPNLSIVSSPVQGLAGPRAGIDKAVGFDSLTDELHAGDNYDVTATDDLCIAWVGMWAAHPSGVEMLVVKRNADPNGYTLFVNGVSGLRWDVHSASGGVITSGDITSLIGKWHVGMAVIDRSTGKSRVAVRALDGSATLLSSEQTLFVETSANADNLQVGNRTNLPATSWKCAALYIAHGSGACTGMSANLSTAIQNFANAVNSSFTISLGTDGRATISNSFWPSSVAFTNTTLRDVLGFEYNFDYPQTPAQMASAFGGVWTNGAAYLGNESSGNLAPVFGAPTLTATSLVYSLQGARGGSDKAIGFDAAGDNASGGDVFDGDADLVLVWVGHTTASPAGSRDWFSKSAGGANGYYIFRNSSGQITFNVDDGVATLTTGGIAQLNNEQHVGAIVLERATNKIRIAIRGLTSGTTNISAEASIATLGNIANATAFKIGSGALSSADTDLQISAFYIVTGTGVATGLSANLSAALSSFAAYMKGQTSTQQARGVWYPDCTINLEGDPKRAPLMSDARQSMSPTGQMITLVGNTFRRHRDIVWSHVPINRVWDAEAPYENASWEEFFTETQLGLGSSWFTPGSPVQIYYPDKGIDTLVGADATIPGWSMVGVRSTELRKASGDYTGLWRIEIPQLIAAGS